jgi:hypothetical protein
MFLALIRRRQRGTKKESTSFWQSELASTFAVLFAGVVVSAIGARLAG